MDTVPGARLRKELPPTKGPSLRRIAGFDTLQSALFVTSVYAPSESTTYASSWNTKSARVGPVNRIASRDDVGDGATGAVASQPARVKAARKLMKSRRAVTREPYIACSSETQLKRQIL